MSLSNVSFNLLFYVTEVHYCGSRYLIHKVGVRKVLLLLLLLLLVVNIYRMFVLCLAP